ncbi:MAG: redoxin domain-containing protein [Dissulfurispiraceae bacterium]
MELEALEEVFSDIKQLGASLVAISPQRGLYLKKMSEKLGLSFDLLHDYGNKVASQYGLTFTLPNELRIIYGGFGVDLPKVNGDDTWTLPMPARIIIDQQGIIRSVDADPDYTVRADPQRTLEILKKITDK